MFLNYYKDETVDPPAAYDETNDKAGFRGGPRGGGGLQSYTFTDFTLLPGYGQSRLYTVTNIPRQRDHEGPEDWGTRATQIKPGEPNFGNFAVVDTETIINPPKPVSVQKPGVQLPAGPTLADTTVSTWEWLSTIATATGESLKDGAYNIGVGAWNAGKEAAFYVTDIFGVCADAIGELAGCPLGYKELSSVGKGYYESTNMDIAQNAARSGLAAGTLGVSELVGSWYQYAQDGDAAALQQHAGGVATGNGLGALGAKLGGVNPRFSMKTNSGVNGVLSNSLKNITKADVASLPADIQRALSEVQAGKNRPNVRRPKPYENVKKEPTDTPLPKWKEDGTPIEYIEHTVNPRTPNGLDGKRIITGSDGSIWVTFDHFKNWIRLQ